MKNKRGDNLKKIIIIICAFLLFASMSYAESIDKNNLQLKTFVDEYINENFNNIVYFSQDEQPASAYKIIDNNHKEKVIFDEWQELFFRIYDFDILNIEHFEDLYCLDIAINGLQISTGRSLKFFTEEFKLDKDNCTPIHSAFKLIIHNNNGKWEYVKEIKPIKSHNKQLQEFVEKQMFPLMPQLIKDGYEDPYDYYFNQFSKAINAEDIDDGIKLVEYYFESDK